MSYLTAIGKMLIADDKLLIKPPIPPIVDYDGNVYTEIVIGTQTWLKENLRTTHYNNGDAIPKPTQPQWQADWNGLHMCFRNFNDANKNIWGGYYNYYVWQNRQDMAPAGYKIPAIADFNTLAAYITKVQQLMNTSLTYWTQGLPSPGIGTDDWGFDGRGAGDIEWNGSLINDRTFMFFGYTHVIDSLSGTYYNSGIQFKTIDVQNYMGVSLRCIKI